MGCNMTPNGLISAFMHSIILVEKIHSSHHTMKGYNKRKLHTIMIKHKGVRGMFRIASNFTMMRFTFVFMVMPNINLKNDAV